MDFGNPTILRDNRRTRITFQPFYLNDSARRLTGKIVTETKKDGEYWFVEEKFLALKPEEWTKLHQALGENFAIAKDASVGDEFILVKVSEGVADIGAHRPADVAEALTTILSQDKIVNHLKGLELSEELSRALRGSIRVKEISVGLAKLKSMLGLGENDEKHYQKWYDEHPWSLGTGYVRLTDARNITPSDNTDGLVADITSGFSDVIELKRPDMLVLRYDSSHRNHYWSVDCAKAIGQCQRYLDQLAHVARSGLTDHPEVVAHHPRALIVIGRSEDWNDDANRALHGLNQRLHGVRIMTYDHLIAQIENLLNTVTPNETEEEVAEIPDEDEFSPF